VFKKYQACHNVVNLLAVDAKTFVYYKKNNIGITAYKADMKFSGWKGWGGFDRGGNAQGIDENSKTISGKVIYLIKLFITSSIISNDSVYLEKNIDHL
jgi:hypothetical protein